MTAFNSKWKYENLAVRLIVRVRGHFALLFCRGRLWGVQRFTEHTCTAIVLLIKPFVWWCSLTSWFAPDSVHTTREEFKKAYSFMSMVRLSVQNNPSRKWSFSKTLFKPEEFEKAGFEFSCGRKTFSNTIGSGEPRDFSGRDFLEQKYKTTGDCCVLKLLLCSMDGKGLGLGF